MTNKISIPQQSLVWSIFYHFLPAICILLFYLIVSSWIGKLGFQPSFGLLLGFIFIGIPLQLFIMLREGYKINGRITLSNVIYYTKRIPIWQYFVFVIILIVYALIITALLSPVNSFLLENCFSWMPEHLRNSSQLIKENALPNIIVISFITLITIDGFINPIIEELYFRGYLMPRISRFGYWAPFISAFLFSLAHFWQPWNALQLFILVLPIYFLVLRKRSIFISIVLHCVANLIGVSLTIGQYFSG